MLSRTTTSPLLNQTTACKVTVNQTFANDSNMSACPGNDEKAPLKPTAIAAARNAL
jgi:hypothetical protein